MNHFFMKKMFVVMSMSTAIFSSDWQEKAKKKAQARIIQLGFNEAIINEYDGQPTAMTQAGAQILSSAVLASVHPKASDVLFLQGAYNMALLSTNPFHSNKMQRLNNLPLTTKIGDVASAIVIDDFVTGGAVHALRKQGFSTSMAYLLTGTAKYFGNSLIKDAAAKSGNRDIMYYSRYAQGNWMQDFFNAFYYY